MKIQYILFLIVLSANLISNEACKNCILKELEHDLKSQEETFVLTSGKSGTHLLLCMIMNTTLRPVRTIFPGLPLDTNLLEEELDFTKPAIYFGHDESYIEKYKYSGSKLVSTLRNYKEVILSYLFLSRIDINTSS